MSIGPSFVAKIEHDKCAQQRNDVMNIFFGRKKKLVQEAYRKNALILDVRTPEEFGTGHIRGAKNIPLQMFSSKIDQLKRLKQPIITCCASGMRSASARHLLSKHGIEDVVNGGSWQNVERYILED